jgi:ribonuclease D
VDVDDRSAGAGLRAWRHTTARAARIDDAAVLPDHVVDRIVRARPPDVRSLGEVPGVGPVLAHRFGHAILAALEVRSGERRGA